MKYLIIIYCLIGLIIMIKDWYKIEKTFMSNPGWSPFYYGFRMGLFKCSHIIMYPFYLLSKN